MSETKNPEICRFVRAADFALPEKPAGERARNFFRDFLKKISRKKEERRGVDVQAELRSVPQKLLDWVAPYPNWESSAAAVFSLIRPWLENRESEDLFRVFVAPPGSGLDEVLVKLAEDKGWPVGNPPDYAQLTGRDFSWIEKLPRSNDVPVVIAKLENMFLRHFNGLEHLRLLFERLFHSRQRCLIGCNSWLWKYLEVAMHFAESFPEPYFLQSMSAEDLQHFFCELEMQKGPNATIFRQADNGSFVLPFEQTSEGKLDKDMISEYEASKDDFPALFLKKLAAESRGIPLVAWSIWRNSLKLAPEDEVADVARDAAIADSGKTIWVKPFEKLLLPQMPAAPAQAASFLLQFLLLHDGLPPDIIFELLDFEKDLVLSLLHRLKKAGIVVAERGLWRVSWQGYPEVRRFLAQEDYLLDAM